MLSLKEDLHPLRLSIQVRELGARGRQISPQKPVNSCSLLSVWLCSRSFHRSLSPRVQYLCQRVVPLTSIFH